MTSEDHLLSFPPPSDRRVLGLFRPAQVVALLIGILTVLLALTNFSATVGVVVSMITLGLAAAMCLCTINGEPLEAVVLSLVWLFASALGHRLLGDRGSRGMPRVLMVTVHHPDLYLEDTGTQWRRTSAVGRALAAGAQAMKTDVQLLTVRRSLLSASLLTRLDGDDSAHPFVTVLIARASEAADTDFGAMVRALTDAGASCGTVTQHEGHVVAFGKVRRAHRDRCVTRRAVIGVFALRRGPLLPVTPTALMELLVCPPWALLAITVHPVPSPVLQRRIERRQTAALANAELLERRGFRRSAAQQDHSTRAAQYEAAIASGERAVLTSVHLACVEDDTDAYAKAQRELLSRAERCGLQLLALSGRHHLAVELFGAPEVLA